MAQFTLTWDNTDELASTNSTGQRLSYRKRATAGAWSVDGFTPNNDLATNVITAISKILDDNTVWQFKIDTLCTTNGPVSNDNGYVDQIGFAEIVPTLAHTHDTATITLDVS